MSIYYVHSNKVHADRLEPWTPNSETHNRLQKASVHSRNNSIDSFGQKYDIFGTDLYIENKIVFKPIFKLYNNIYK